jgi:hypothetical protein
VCLDCLIDDNPEIGRALDIAREYGVADLDETGEWVIGDLGRLETRDSSLSTQQYDDGQHVADDQDRAPPTS